MEKGDASETSFDAGRPGVAPDLQALGSKNENKKRKITYVTKMRGDNRINRVRKNSRKKNESKNPVLTENFRMTIRVEGTGTDQAFHDSGAIVT